MTEMNEQSEMFEATFSIIVTTIRAAFVNGQSKYRYENIVESNGGQEISAIVKPFESGVLSTELRIHIYPFDSKTKVRIEIKSEKFKYGDVADFYGGYIREFFGMIHSGLGHQAEPSSSAVPLKVDVPMKWWYIVNFVGIFILYGKSYLIPLGFGDSIPPDSPHSISRTMFLSKVGMLVGVGTIAFMMAFNYWWRKKYFQSLDPKLQMSMDYGRQVGRRNGIFLAFFGILFFIWLFFIKR